MSLASLLPYDHAYAGGYPGIGSQPLPTDADALDYLSRMATADGAGVETGVAVAVDAFVRDAKELGVFSSLKACCILAGARTLAGALVPVVGDAPTNVANGFVSGDYTRGGATPGLKGDGTSYLDSGRAGTDDSQNDSHISVYVSTPAGSSNRTLISNEYTWIAEDDTTTYFRVNASSSVTVAKHNVTGFIGASRPSSTNVNLRIDALSTSPASASRSPGASIEVFRNWNATQYSDATLAFYSIGTSLSLEDLDTAVTNLIARLKFALLTGENPAPYDIDTVTYVVRGYENGGTLQ